jgi:hypothetical protein
MQGGYPPLRGEGRRGGHQVQTLPGDRRLGKSEQGGGQRELWLLFLTHLQIEPAPQAGDALRREGTRGVSSAESARNDPAGPPCGLPAMNRVQVLGRGRRADTEFVGPEAAWSSPAPHVLPAVDLPHREPPSFSPGGRGSVALGAEGRKRHAMAPEVATSRSTSVWRLRPAPRPGRLARCRVGCPPLGGRFSGGTHRGRGSPDGCFRDASGQKEPPRGGR